MGLREEEITEKISKFYKKLPRFPDGRINYSNSNVALVVTVFLKHNDRILLLKRSNKVSTYRGKWNTVAGYLDELKPIREKVVEEIREELGVGEENILSCTFGESYEFTDQNVNKTWVVHPVLVRLKDKPAIKLDWEHTTYKWIKPEELKKFDIVPRLDDSLKRVLN